MTGPKNAAEEEPGGAQLWGGRFQGGLHPIFDELNRSLPFDRRFLFEDILGSQAWASALEDAGVLTSEEASQLMDELGQMHETLSSDPSRLDESRAEDIHSFIEEWLVENLGGLGKKLHTGRSRNDQVATDLKLWMRHSLCDMDGLMGDLQLALVGLAEKHADVALAGYTHLQRAQPITFGHQCLSYVEMLARDRGRLADAEARTDTCPLGSGALAGTAYPVDREDLAMTLGFREATHNSLDAVSDRDHVLEVIFAALTTMLHLSRLAEDWIFLASQESGFLTFGDSVSTGSSLMPQKRNPDALELLRGKVGRVHGALTTLVTTFKGLPLAYDKDLQEDKEALFEAFDTTCTCLKVAKLVVEDVEVHRARGHGATRSGYLDATDLADLLVKHGVPFREAHDRVGEAVNAAVREGVELGDLSSAMVNEIMPELDGVELGPELTTEAMLARRDVIGGTAVVRVKAEIARWKKILVEDE